MKKDLETLYHQVNDAVLSLDPEKIWPGFELLKFALYDNDYCFFDGQFIEKTDDFCANTSISFRGEQIAIWMVAEELDIPVLTSKLVHEMFHGFQTLQGWNCWPNETEALLRYEYNTENLYLKLHENKLLLSLLDHFDETSYRELMSCRKLRSEKYPFEFSYESKVEEIEGTANYVEWQVLKQLDGKAAEAMTERMISVMTEPEFLFPIRIACYYTGALMINALRGAGAYSFEPGERPVIMEVLNDIVLSKADFDINCPDHRKVSETIAAYNERSESIVRSALEKNEVVLEGPLELVSVNIYNARCYKEYLTSTHFLMYRDGEGNKMIRGNFVIHMKDEKTIGTVYRCE